MSLYSWFPKLLNDTKALGSNIQSDNQNLNSMSRTKALIEDYSNLDSKSFFNTNQIHKIKSMENKNNLNIIR